MAKKQQLNILETEVGEAVKSSELFGKMQYAEEIGIGNGSCDLVYYSDTKVIAIELKTKVNYPRLKGCGLVRLPLFPRGDLCTIGWLTCTLPSKFSMHHRGAS